MKLQVAIDRVDVDRAAALTGAVAGIADIVEVGTSLTKEFGLRSLQPILDAAGETDVLADIKTCDEGKYEFDLGAECGFSYLTVMGSASIGTLEVCARSAREHATTMMIDLLECSDARIASIVDALAEFPEVVYCLHTSIDSGATTDPAGQVRKFRTAFPSISRIAAAGGLTLDRIARLE